jgi:hypothetical protein
MKRIISVLAVLAIMVAMLTASAMPAFAIGGPPNCELGQLEAQGNAFARGDIDQGGKHARMGFNCARDIPPGEVVNNN